MPDFPIYNKCNNKCLMCSNPEENLKIEKSFFSFSALSKRIERFYEGEDEFLNNYGDCFSITGGEPTLSAHLFPLIKKINSFFPGIKITCLSNGRRFSYTAYTKSFFQLAPNLELNISLHGHNASLHDRITQAPGSFNEMVSGMKNIFKLKLPGQSIGIRIIIHGLNYKFIGKILEFVEHNFSRVNSLVLIFFELEGQACVNFQQLKLSYSQFQPYLNKIKKSIKLFPQIQFYHFPLCVLPESFFPYMWRTLPASEVDFLQACENCKLRQLCLGIHKNYLRHMGASEFKPITKKMRIITRDNWYNPIEKIISQNVCQ